MKIAYILNYSVENVDGVIRKINTQVGEWKKKGNEVKLYCLFSCVENPVIEVSQFHCSSVMAKKLCLQKEFIKDIETFKPDLVYMRYTYWNRTIGYIQNKYPNIIELNTLDKEENILNYAANKTFRNFIKMILNGVLRNWVLKEANGFVSVTNEIAKDSSISKFKKKNVVVTNPYKLDSAVFRKEVAQNNRIGLFFIGSPNQEWHGIDIIESMAHLLPEFDFHIVGIADTNKTNVFYHGFQNKDEYLLVMKKCSICIGTLAGWRKNLYELSPLKVREYLAYGYPIIIGYNETAFCNLEEEPEWVLRIDTQKELNIDKIKQFVYRMKDYIIDSDVVKKLIDSEITESYRLEFMKEIIDENTDN